MATYRLQSSRQGLLGPIRAAAVRDLAEAGVAHADTLVSKDGGPFLSFRAFPELVEAAGDKLGKGPAPAFSGDLVQRTLLRLMDRVSGSRLTGQLVVRDGIRRMDIYFDAGRLAFVMSAAGRDRLGDLLVCENLATREQIEAALDRVKQDNRGLGATLIESGVVTREALRSAVREQALTRLVEVCAWSSGHYAFFEGTTFAVEHVDIGDIMPRVFVRAARSVAVEILRDRLRTAALEVVTDPDVARKPGWVAHLEGEEQLALSQIDGERTVTELLSLAPADSALGRALLSVVYLCWESGLTVPASL